MPVPGELSKQPLTAGAARTEVPDNVKLYNLGGQGLHALVPRRGAAPL